MPRALLPLLVILLCAVAAPPALAGEPDATAPAYRLDLQGADGGFAWSGRQTLTITNPGALPLDRVWIRLWGNGPQGCKPQAVRIANLAGAAAGAPVQDCTAVELRLTVPLAPGARGSVAFDVDIKVPRDIRDRFGRGGRRVALLSNAVPALAHLEGGRWRLDRYFAFGEAWTYPAAAWDVKLDAPPGISVAAPGVRGADGRRRLARGRDYSWAAGALHRLRARVGPTDVTVWGAATARRASLRRTLAIVRKRLPRLASLYGPYGWPDLQVIVTGAAAMEHTGLIMTPPVDFVVTHELAHEWWYALISNDQAQAPWLDESFATFAEETAGDQPAVCRRPEPGAGLVTRTTAFFLEREFSGYGQVYVGGACLLDVLQRRLGRARFRAALSAYALANRNGWSTAAEFRAHMDAASSVALGDLWRRYRVR